MTRILLCNDDVGDWKTIYYDGIARDEGHSFPMETVIKAVLKAYPCEFRSVNCGDVGDLLALFQQEEGYFDMPSTMDPALFDAVWAKAE